MFVPVRREYIIIYIYLDKYTYTLYIYIYNLHIYIYIYNIHIYIYIYDIYMTKQPVCVLGITMENAGSQPSCFSLEDCKGVEYNAETGRCNLRCPGMMMTLPIG